jgi:uncharacterized protein DUF5677
MTPEELEPRVSAAIKLMQNEIDDTCFCPRNSVVLDRALAMVVSRSLRVGLAVCGLVSAGFYGEAFGLTRSVLEGFFIVKYISSGKNPEARAGSYIEFRKAHYYNQEQIRQKHFPHVERPTWLAQAILDDGQKLPSTRHWVSAYTRATDYYDHSSEIDPKTGKGFQAASDYDGVYEMTSQYVHMSVVSTSPNFIASPFKTAKRDKEEGKGFLALHFSLVYIWEVCIILGRQWDSVFVPSVNETIQKLLTDLRAATSPGDPSVWSAGISKKP